MLRRRVRNAAARCAHIVPIAFAKGFTKSGLKVLAKPGAALAAWCRRQHNGVSTVACSSVCSSPLALPDIVTFGLLLGPARKSTHLLQHQMPSQIWF